MKTQTLLALLLICTGLLTAQSEKKQTQETKVRIKKVENINGVEKITDTTYTLNGPLNTNDLEALELSVPPLPPLPPLPSQKEDLIIVTDQEDQVQVMGTQADEKSTNKSKAHKIVIITDEIHGDNFKEVKIEDEMDEQMQNALKAAGVNQDDVQVEKVVIINGNCKSDETKKEVTRVVIVKSIKMSELSPEDQKMLYGKPQPKSSSQFMSDDIRFSPNPNNGKFNLSFTLKDKGDTEINIINPEGKSVYSEKLPNFNGTYNKEIDISNQNKGIYFLKVSQGKNVQAKKLLIE